MKSIRRINPSAQLVQTEDVGRVFATRRLQYQADYENERRWLALDLLTGRVDREHPFFRALLAAGISRDHLDELASEPCTPDVIGLDYYLTSDRLIDQRTTLYPQETIGGNGRHAYADIAAVRSEVPGKERTGLQPRLEEVWDRYGLPIAVTELHNGSTRDEQLRWLWEGWQAAQAARSRGIDVQAVTSWSLFGAADWNSMLTRQDGYYEAGAFDTRSVQPRHTAIARAITKLAAGDDFDHPVLDRPGWWRGDTEIDGARPIALIGFGHLISVIERCCHARRLRVVSAAPTDNAASVFDRHRAWALIEIGHSKSRSAPFDLSCRYTNGETLTVEVGPAQNDLESITNAFIDLLVDATVGNMQIMWAGPANQYELSNMARDPLLRTG